MFRGFLFLIVGVLTLLFVAGIPAQLYAQHSHGGFRPGARPQVGPFSPGFDRRFMDPRFGEFSPSFDRRFLDPRFGEFSPSFDPRFIDPRFSRFTPGMDRRFIDPRFVMEK